jgi:hypothetical protein
MRTNAARTQYVGATLADERRAVLVAIDHDDPWNAFRQLRRSMRRERGRARIALYESPTPIGHAADVISLEERRQAG